MAKLTPAQRRVLERMSNGDEVWTVGGRRTSAFWHRAVTDRSPSFATLHVLEKGGFIENKADKWTGREYRITEAGRRALQSDAEQVDGR